MYFENFYEWTLNFITFNVKSYLLSATGSLLQIFQLKKWNLRFLQSFSSLFQDGIKLLNHVLKSVLIGYQHFESW